MNRITDELVKRIYAHELKTGKKPDVLELSADEWRELEYELMRLKAIGAFVGDGPPTPIGSVEFMGVPLKLAKA